MVNGLSYFHAYMHVYRYLDVTNKTSAKIGEGLNGLGSLDGVALAYSFMYVFMYVWVLVSVHMTPFLFLLLVDVSELEPFVGV